MRSSSRFLLLLIAIAAVAVGIGYGLKAMRNPTSAVVPGARHPGDVAAPETANASPDTNDTEPHVVTAAERAAAAQQPAVVHATARPVAAPASTEPRPEPTPQTRQLVSGLAGLDFSHGSITPEQATQWKQ